ncbi:MAG: hypothetical protein P8M18_05685 [Woeseiaceae bacterium]|nr:hypothetical protein [Woeseiaceae bacterium]
MVPLFLLADLAVAEQDHHFAVGSFHDVDDCHENLLKPFVGYTQVFATTDDGAVSSTFAAGLGATSTGEASATTGSSVNVGADGDSPFSC